MAAIIQVNGVDVLATTRLVSGEVMDRFDKFSGIDIDCLELLSSNGFFDVNTEVLRDLDEFEGSYSIPSVDGKFFFRATLQRNHSENYHNLSITVEKLDTKESIGTRDNYEYNDSQSAKRLKSIGTKVLIGYLMDDILSHQERQVIEKYKKDKTIRRVP